MEDKKSIVVVGAGMHGATTAIEASPDMVVVDDLNEAISMVDIKSVDGSYILYNTGPIHTPVHRNYTPIVREGKKVHNNEPCPCNSGLKYKKCCKNK